MKKQQKWDVDDDYNELENVLEIHSQKREIIERFQENYSWFSSVVVTSIAAKIKSSADFRSIFTIAEWDTLKLERL